MTAVAKLPPLDPNLSDDADADLERRIAVLRSMLASEARVSRQCLIRAELLEAERLRRLADG